MLYLHPDIPYAKGIRVLYLVAKLLHPLCEWRDCIHLHGVDIYKLAFVKARDINLPQGSQLRNVQHAQTPFTGGF